jgi:hypothetical protein
VPLMAPPGPRPHYYEWYYAFIRDLDGEGLKLLENWRGASFADLIHQTGFSEPGKGAPHGDEDTRFAAHT